jgi:hypothetical protein
MRAEERNGRDAPMLFSECLALFMARINGRFQKEYWSGRPVFSSVSVFSPVFFKR